MKEIKLTLKDEVMARTQKVLVKNRITINFSKHNHFHISICHWNIRKHCTHHQSILYHASTHSHNSGKRNVSTGVTVCLQYTSIENVNQWCSVWGLWKDMKDVGWQIVLHGEDYLLLIECILCLCYECTFSLYERVFTLAHKWSQDKFKWLK